jgi:hypothetical protein
MAPKKTRKPIQETMVKDPTQDPKVPPEFVGEEEQEDSEDQEVQVEQDDPGSEEE